MTTLVAVANIVLVAITAVTVFLNYRLLRAQDLGPKREIVEKVYKPVGDHLERIISGDWPTLKTWDDLKNKQPFLAFHHLIPAKIREGLDGASSQWRTSRQDAYDRLVPAIMQIASEQLGLSYEEP